MPDQSALRIPHPGKDTEEESRVRLSETSVVLGIEIK